MAGGKGCGRGWPELPLLCCMVIVTGMFCTTSVDDIYCTAPEVSLCRHLKWASNWGSMSYKAKSIIVDSVK